MLYSLSLFNERQEDFFIGLFVSQEKARQTAEHYVSVVTGFRNYPCTYEITEKPLVGTVGLQQEWSLDTYRIGQCHWTEGFVRSFPSEQGIRPDGQTLLPQRITGFWNVDTDPPPFLDEKALYRMCHTLAWENGGTVTEVDADTIASNFYFAKLSRYDQSVFILQNIHYPYAVFAQRDASGGFILTSQPKWLQLPEGPERFLSLAELNRDWHGLCGELNAEELEQIRYWKLQTVVEIIFNTWD